MSERRRITEEWSLEIDPSFQGRLIDGDLQLVSIGPPVRTIWVAVWSPPAGQTVEETLAAVAADAHPSPTQRISEQGADTGERRYANWYPERVDGRQQWGLYAYTARPGSCVQAAFVSDEESGLAWALEAWRSLRWTPAEEA